MPDNHIPANNIAQQGKIENLAGILYCLVGIHQLPGSGFVHHAEAQPLHREYLQGVPSLPKTPRSQTAPGLAAFCPPSTSYEKGSIELLPCLRFVYLPQTRYRKVTAWALVQIKFGEKLTAEVPLVTSVSRAQSTASRYQASSFTSRKGHSVCSGQDCPQRARGR